jgi:hypothetical protein
MLNQGRLVMRPDFPFMRPNDFALVEDTSQPGCPAVACACFWRHQWSFAGIPFGVGRPEFVATDPAYRNRGLVRAIFEMHHARSAAEGHLMQAITGIPYFYRQFGYEFVLDLGGHRVTYLSQIPDKKDAEPEPFTLRLATLADLPLLMCLYDRGRDASLIWHEASEDYWRLQINYWHEPDVIHNGLANAAMDARYLVIEHSEHGACGCIAVPPRRWGRDLAVYALDVSPEVDLPTALPSLLRLLRTVGEETPCTGREIVPCREISWSFGRKHAVYDLLGDALAPRSGPPYAWYIRVPDVLAFLHHVQPVLEKRLACSHYAHYTGELHFDLYRTGLALRFEHGKVAAIEPWRTSDYSDEASLGCPPLVFLQMLLGYRTISELNTFYPDAWVEDDVRLLVNTLFPAQHSTVRPLA